MVDADWAGDKSGRASVSGSFGPIVEDLSVGQPRNRIAWRCHQWRWNTWHSPRPFRRGFGLGTHSGRWRYPVPHPSSFRLTTMVHFLWHPTTLLMDVRNTLTYDIISFALTSKTMSSTSFTLLGSSIRPTSSPNRSGASSFKSMLHGLVWALAEGVCWE